MPWKNIEIKRQQIQEKIKQANKPRREKAIIFNIETNVSVKTKTLDSQIKWLNNKIKSKKHIPRDRERGREIPIE